MLTISESASVNRMTRSSEPPVAIKCSSGGGCRVVLLLTERQELSCLVACDVRHG